MSDYFKMGEKALSDTSQYEKVFQSEKDTINKLNEEYELVLKDELAKSNISKDLYEYLTHPDLDGIGPAPAYFLPKIHKLTQAQIDQLMIPKGRSILPTNNSLLRKLDNFVSKEMTPFINDNYIPDFLKDTPHLLEQLNDDFDNNIPSNIRIQTSDVVVMYPNIKICMILEAWKKIWSSNPTTVPCKTLCQFLELVLSRNLIEFNGQLYRQIDGLGQGLVLSLPASNGVMLFESIKIK